MLIEGLAIAGLVNSAKIVSGSLSIIGIIFGIFKGYTWVKTKLSSIDSNVVALKQSMDASIGGLREDIKHQTTTLAAALSEQRQDFRTFYAPLLMLQQQPAPLRARPRKRAVKK